MGPFIPGGGDSSSKHRVCTVARSRTRQFPAARDRVTNWPCLKHKDTPLLNKNTTTTVILRSGVIFLTPSSSSYKIHLRIEKFWKNLLLLDLWLHRIQNLGRQNQIFAVGPMPPRLSREVDACLCNLVALTL